MPDWLAAARLAAQGADWPEAARLLFSHQEAWPDDASFLMEIAGWLRMAGHGGRAGKVLNRAAALGDSYGVALEAEALEWPLARQPARPHPATLLLDIQDLLQFLCDHGSVSGIQRVQLGILAAVLEGEAGPLGERCLAVFPSLADGAIWAPPRDALAAIVAHCTGAGLNRATARRLVMEARLRALRVTPAPGVAFIMLGAFWFYVGAPRFLLGLRNAGVRVGVLIYDMFPATHPECATADTRQYFLQALGEGMPFWDFAFAISEYSAAAFRRVAASRGSRPIETVAIPLAHSFDLAREAPPAWLDTWPAALGDLRGRDFVLAVSTIEIRKNHLLLFHAWKRMIEAGDNPPTLVLVGRPGWGVTDLMAQLEATRWLDGRIMIVHGLSDAELEALYRACLFTVMPSLAEGWGLAVGESLSFGKPCIAADGSALPEVGGDLVTYADPGNVPEWVSRLRGWMQDRPALAEAAARIARDFVPRRWPAVAQHLLAEAERMRALPAAPTPEAAPMLLLPGKPAMIGLTDLSAPGAAAQALAQAMALEAGWHSLEGGLCWMRGRNASLVACLDLPPGEALHVTFTFLTPPWPGGNALTVTLAGGPPTRMEVMHGQPLRISATGHVPADRMLRVRFDLDHRPPPHTEDQRGLCLALSAVLLREREPAPAAATPVVAELPRVGQVAGGFWVDLSGLCVETAETWSARRWRLGLAQALSRVAGLGWAATRGHSLVEVPPSLALALLSATTEARCAMLERAREGLSELRLGYGDRLLTLGLAADTIPARLARRAGATVTLTVASIAALLRPYRAPAQMAADLHTALFAPHSPFDAVLLAVDDPQAAGFFAAQARPLPWGVLPRPGSAILPLPPGDQSMDGPEEGCVLTESLEPVMAESWAGVPGAPPLHLLQADDSVAIAALLGACRLVVAPNLAGAWPGMALAAVEAGLPCLTMGLTMAPGTPAFDPADARANAAALSALLDQGSALPVATGVSWEAVAMAALRFDPIRPDSHSHTAPPPVLTLPAVSQGWALAATRRP